MKIPWEFFHHSRLKPGSGLCQGVPRDLLEGFLMEKNDKTVGNMIVKIEHIYIYIYIYIHTNMYTVFQCVIYSIQCLGNFPCDFHINAPLTNAKNTTSIVPRNKTL